MNWELPASSGRNHFRGAFHKEVLDASGGSNVLTTISISGTFWDRAQKISEADEKDDFTVTLHQMLLRLDQLNELAEQLDSWQGKSRNIRIQLTTDINQVLIFRLGQSKSNSADKSVCKIEYRSNVFMLGRWEIRVDQSCVRMFFESLSESLRQLRRN